MKLPLILFSTASEFWQQNVIPGAAQEGVGAFAEPGRYRIVMPIDEPPDLLYRLIVHELTHQFQFDIIPTGLIRRNMPLWVFEGMSDYMTGYWRPLDIMTVRDAAVSDIVPKMSEMQEYGGFSNPRLIYNLGHAAFEFMESKWGKEGVRAYVFALRRSVIGGSDDAYQEAFQITPEEWDQQFDRYLKERFKPFRDKERPADYGRDLAPDPRKGRFSNVLSIEPSPSGDLIAGMTGNGRDREYDIVLISAKDGAIIRNLTSGFDQSMGFEYLATPGGRWNSVPWMSWSPQGDRLAYFVRTEKDRSLIVQNVVSKKIEVRIPLTTIDAPESPDFSPDGKLVAFSGMRGSDADIFTVNLETKEIVNLTKDKFANYAPTWAPDGRSIVYLVRVSGNEKLFRMDAERRQPDAADVRHARRRRRAVPRRQHAGVRVDGGQPRRADRAGGREERADLQHLDARPEDQRAEAVHRRAVGQRLAGGAARTRRPNRARVRHLFQGRVRPAHARAQGRDHQGRVGGLRLARPDRRLPGAADAHAGARQPEEEGQVREAVPRGPAAGRARRDERRRRVRRHAGDLHRRARRSAVQPVHLVGVAVPHHVLHVAEHGEARCSGRCRATTRRSSTTASSKASSTIPYLSAVHRSRSRDRDAHHPGRHGVRAFIRSTAIAASRCSAASTATRRATTIRGRRRSSERIPGGAVTASRCSTTAT